MATLRTYGATVEGFSALMHLRLSEASGATASDSAGDLDGQYRGGIARGAEGGRSATGRSASMAAPGTW